MKDKSGPLNLIIVLVGLVAAAWAANALYDQKKVQTPHEVKTPTQFYAGMDKFLSNVSWMTLIQWQADNAQRQLTPEAAESLYSKLDSLTNLDPRFRDAYLNGALALAPHRNGDLSVKLLDKAIDMGAGDNWKVPFYAGHVRATAGGDPKEAERYFQLAVQDRQAPDYVHTALIRSRCVSAGDQPVQSMRIWHAYFLTVPAENATQRRIAASQIREYAEAAGEEINGNLQSTTQPVDREQMAADQQWVQQVLAELDVAVPRAPEPPPETEEEDPTTAPAPNI